MAEMEARGGTESEDFFLLPSTFHLQPAPEPRRKSANEKGKKPETTANEEDENYDGAKLKPPGVLPSISTAPKPPALKASRKPSDARAARAVLSLLEKAPEALHIRRSKSSDGFRIPQIPPPILEDPFERPPAPEDTASASNLPVPKITLRRATPTVQEIVASLRDSISSLESLGPPRPNPGGFRRISRSAEGSPRMESRNRSRTGTADSHLAAGFASISINTSAMVNDPHHPFAARLGGLVLQPHGHLTRSQHPAVHPLGAAIPLESRDDPAFPREVRVRDSAQNSHGGRSIDPREEVRALKEGSSYSGPRTKLDYKERLLRSNFVHVRGDTASRRKVEKKCLNEKDKVIKKISATETDRTQWTWFIVAYAKGKFNVSDDCDWKLPLGTKMQFFPPPTPINEFDRVRALRNLGPLPLYINPLYLKRAAKFIGVDNITVSIIDRQGEIVVGSTLPIVWGIPRQKSFACHAMLNKGIMEVCDLTKDWRFKNHPFVAQPPHFQYFACAPIVTADETDEEYNIGACSVYEIVPQKPLNYKQRIKLTNFAATILMEIRFPGPISPLSTDTTPATSYFSSFSTEDEEEYEHDAEWATDEESEEEIPYTPTRNPRRLQPQGSDTGLSLQAALRTDPNEEAIEDEEDVEDVEEGKNDRRVSSVIYLPSVPKSVSRPQAQFTRRIGKPHPKGLPILPLYAPGNWSPEIRFVAHEMAIRLGYGLLVLMRITPMDVSMPPEDIVTASNYRFEILASFGMETILTKTNFRPDPVIPVRALRDSFGSRHMGQFHKIDVDNVVNCVLGLVAPIKRENWSVRLDDIKDPVQRDKARLEMCVGGLVLAGYMTGIPHPSVIQNRDEMGELCSLSEAGQLMYEMLVEFRPGSDYDPAAFGARLAEKDSFFKGYKLVGDDGYMF